MCSISRRNQKPCSSAAVLLSSESRPRFSSTSVSVRKRNANVERHKFFLHHTILIRHFIFWEHKSNKLNKNSTILYPCPILSLAKYIYLTYPISPTNLIRSCLYRAESPVALSPRRASSSSAVSLPWTSTAADRTDGERHPSRWSHESQNCGEDKVWKFNKKYNELCYWI